MVKSLKSKLIKYGTPLLIFNLLNISHYPNLKAFEESESKIEIIKKEDPLTFKEAKNVFKSEYTLGPGDEIYIHFEGIDLFTNNYSINNEGSIFLPEIGYYEISGMTINDVKSDLKVLYRDIIYETNINVSLLTRRPVNVYIYGEVKNPGLYTLNHTFRKTSNKIFSVDNMGANSFQYDTTLTSPKLFNALQISKGVTKNADLSKLKVIRDNSKGNGGGRIQTEINLLNLIMTGDQSHNIILHDGDTIFVPETDKLLNEQFLAINKSNLNPSIIKVYVTGNVRTPGELVLEKGSTLNQGIIATGGKRTSSGLVEFIRFKSDGSVIKRKFRHNFAAERETKNNPVLRDGDIINVRKTILGKTTEILSEVTAPLVTGIGLYNIFDD